MVDFKGEPDALMKRDFGEPLGWTFCIRIVTTKGSKVASPKMATVRVPKGWDLAQCNLDTSPSRGRI